MPKISVVMPVYNQKEEYLREAIESILNQTYKDFEFIIVNDGSTNNSEEVILSYKDERIKYLKQENQGVARSLNNGIEIANGEYIARMDSDDISLPERFEKQIKFLDEHPEVSILGTSYEAFPRKRITQLPANVKYADLLKTCCICHPSVMMRKADLDKYNLRYNPEFTSEDYELWSRAVQYLNIQNLREVLVKYRWHEENISHQAGIFNDSDTRIRERMLSFLTDNTKMQEQILYLASTMGIQYKPIEKIFSIKNFKIGNKKYKSITILGKHFYIRGKKDKFKNFPITMNIAFAINRTYVDKLCVCLTSILENNKNVPIKFYIMNSDLTDDDKDTILKIKKIYKNIELFFVTVNQDIFKNLKLTIDYISKETYYRYLMPDLIEEDKCLYLDADIIVNGNIKKFYETDISNYLCAGAKDLYIKRINYTPKIGLENKLYINAGVILFNLKKLRNEGYVQKLLANNLDMQDIIEFQDQDILNITFKDKIKEVNSIYNFCSANVYAEKIKRKFAKIIHFTGEIKPWEDRYKGKYKNLWNKNKKIFLMSINNMQEGLIKNDRK